MNLKKITLESVDVYNIYKYDEEGFFNVYQTDTNVGIIVLVDKKINLVSYIGLTKEHKRFFDIQFNKDLMILKLQMLKLNNKIDSSSFIRTLTMLGSESESDKFMAEESINTILNESLC